jgi:hypothetical protein
VKRATCIALVAIGVALGTWTLGWWSVPAIAFAAGLIGCRAGLVSAGSAGAWLLLLLFDVASGNVSRVAGALAGIMGMPSVALFAVTLVLPALLGWSAASLGDAARALWPTSRQPS